jgi:hypothetical protein
MPPWHQPILIQSEPTSKLPSRKLQYPIYVKVTDPNARIRVFKKAIKANGEIVEVDIINLFGFTLHDNISEWGENFIQDHPNYTFDELEQAFCKHFWIVKNDEKVYMQLKNLQQQVSKWVEVYYKGLLKLANCLQVKTINVFFTINFKVGLQPYFRLATIGMMRDTLIKHKEVTCEENELVITNYNVLISTRVQTGCIAHSHLYHC